mmetsp:Transcript_26179/g.67527  ORF Transcript_26179/g.67527 Transcript_26179/m.67527 type:complete len:331 (+) Transcript_26179:999-1991(+)
MRRFIAQHHQVNVRGGQYYRSLCDDGGCLQRRSRPHNFRGRLTLRLQLVPQILVHRRGQPLLHLQEQELVVGNDEQLQRGAQGIGRAPLLQASLAAGVLFVLTGNLHRGDVYSSTSSSNFHHRSPCVIPPSLRRSARRFGDLDLPHHRLLLFHLLILKHAGWQLCELSVPALEDPRRLVPLSAGRSPFLCHRVAHPTARGASAQTGDGGVAVGERRRGAADARQGVALLAEGWGGRQTTRAGVAVAIRADAHSHTGSDSPVTLSSAFPPVRGLEVQHSDRLAAIWHLRHPGPRLAGRGGHVGGVARLTGDGGGGSQAVGNAPHDASCHGC